MKPLSIIFVSFVFLFTIACKKEKNQSMTVVIDCSGTYLRIGEKDYGVCNVELIAKKKHGDAVTVTYKPSKLGCTGQYVSCKDKHETAGWIVIEKVK